jgi:DNA-binding CsgD family transcriptional regulator
MGRHKHAVPDDCPLTTTEFEIVSALCDGSTPQQIAMQRASSPSTVRTHLHGAYVKLGVGNSGQAIVTMMRSGWLGYTPAPPEPPESKLSPFLKAYLGEFDKYLASGMTCKQSRDGMRIALAGARNGVRHG